MIKNNDRKEYLKQIGFFPDPSVAKYKILWDKRLCLNNHY
tara:strand:+ start:347 stop:466 length:120 start_codon:yes stop_codon:yes gene_type:complete